MAAVAPPAEPDTKHQGGAFEKVVTVLAAHPGQCDEDHIRDSVFKDDGVLKVFGRYVEPSTAAPPGGLSWKKQLLAGAEAPVGLRVAAGAVDYNRRIRQQLVAFSATIKPNGVELAHATVKLTPEECESIFFVGCKGCRQKHHIVPLGIDLAEYSIACATRTSFTIDLKSKWLDFVNDTAKADGSKLKPAAEPRSWFPAKLFEATPSGMLTRGPQIGTVEQAKDLSDRPRALYRADERFAAPENYTTLRHLLDHRYTPSASTAALRAMGAVQLAGSKRTLLVRQPTTAKHTAPNILSLKYTASFAERNGGASKQLIAAHSFSETGVKVNAKQDKYWMCEVDVLKEILAGIRQEFTKEALAMSLDDDGLSMTFHEDRLSTDWSSVRVVLRITYLVI